MVETKSFSSECWFSAYEGKHYEIDLGDGYKITLDIPRAYDEDFIESSEPVWLRVYYLGGLYIEYILQYLGGGRWLDEFRRGEQYVLDWWRSYEESKREADDCYSVYKSDVSGCTTQCRAGGYFMFKFGITFKEYELPPAESLPISDDFESYSTGTFPNKWKLVWNGRGSQYQVVTDLYSYDGNKCLQLWGRDGWSAVAERKFMPMEDVIVLEGAVMVTAVPTNGKLACRFGFWNRDLGEWGKYFHEFHFHADKKIYCRPAGFSGIYWEPFEWYKCKIVLDRTTQKADFYINDELVMTDVYSAGSDLANGIVLVSDHGGVKCYFDSINLREGQPAFQITSVRLSEDTIQLGEHTTLTVTVKNVGELAGSTWVVATLDGTEIGREIITLDPGMSGTVDFTISTDKTGDFVVCASLE